MKLLDLLKREAPKISAADELAKHIGEKPRRSHTIGDEDDYMDFGPGAIFHEECGDR